MKLHFFYWLMTFLLLPLGILAHGEPKQSLFIVSCDAIKPCWQQTIRRFDFQRGRLISQESIATVPAPLARFHIGPTRILEKRYIVSNWGEIFDLETKTLYAEQPGNFEGFENGKVIIHQIIINMENKTFAFDLAMKQYSLIKESNWYSLVGARKSPDNSKAIDYDSHSGQLIYYTRGKKPTDVAMVGLEGTYRVSCGKNCKDRRKIVPVLWIDNERFITQRKNGELLIFGGPKGKTISVEIIPVNDELEEIPSLYLDEENNIYYQAGKTYRIDVENRKYYETKEYALGNGFKRIGASEMKLFMFDDDELGAFISYRSFSTTGYLAAEYYQDTAAVYSKGIKVWSNESQKWIEIDVNYRPVIVGWVSK